MINDVTIPGEFKPGRRKTIRLSQAELVKIGYLNEDQKLPLVIEPNAENINLATWAAENRELIEAELLKHGAILFRRFKVDSVERFEQFIRSTSGGALEYRERSSPRSQVSGNIYTSTDYPAEQSIFLHNEQSYNLTFPLKIYFFCLNPAAEGGATPIADTRRIFAAIEPQIRARFREKNYLYARNFGDGFGLSWQAAFQTKSRSAVEQYCQQHDISVEWKEGDRLRTRQVRRAVARHPQTGELAWFNHATFFHVSTLESPVRDKVLEEFGEQDLPNNTYYGDGSRIESSVMDELRRAYLQEKVIFDWNKFDVLMLDNMLAAHGREPFAGQRRIVAGMADPFSWEKINS